VETREQEVTPTPQLNGMAEYPSTCHPEESVSRRTTKDLRSSLELQMPGFFAPLRMTGQGFIHRPEAPGMAA
jgi:hypothetical protein